MAVSFSHSRSFSHLQAKIPVCHPSLLLLLILPPHNTPTRDELFLPLSYLIYAYSIYYACEYVMCPFTSYTFTNKHYIYEYKSNISSPYIPLCVRMYIILLTMSYLAMSSTFPFFFFFAYIQPHIVTASWKCALYKGIKGGKILKGVKIALPKKFHLSFPWYPLDVYLFCVHANRERAVFSSRKCKLCH